MIKQNEHRPAGASLSWPQVLDTLAFNAEGLIPAIAQQHDSGEVLMMAWMNREAIRETLETGQVCYWSRSRAALWRKGERSGQVQRLIDLRVDCDGDTLLVLVDQTGVACHTGRRSCFYRAARRPQSRPETTESVRLTRGRVGHRTDRGPSVSSHARRGAGPDPGRRSGRADRVLARGEGERTWNLE